MDRAAWRMQPTSVKVRYWIGIASVVVGGLCWLLSTTNQVPDWLLYLSAVLITAPAVLRWLTDPRTWLNRFNHWWRNP